MTERGNVEGVGGRIGGGGGGAQPSDATITMPFMMIIKII